MNEKSIDSIYIELGARYRKTRSPWSRGVLIYASELLENIRDLDDEKITEKALLNGARDWKEYSYGGCALVYDVDICHRLCTPAEIKRTKDGEKQPNKIENWLDVQTRALYQAAQEILRIEKGC